MAHDIQPFLQAHVIQLSLVLAALPVLLALFHRRWPQLAFLLCMLALLKCLTPPVITSPAGLFTRSERLAFAPQLAAMRASDALNLKQASHTAMADAWSWGDYWPNTLLAVWALGICIVLAYSLRQVLSVHRMLRRMSPAPERVVRLADRMKTEMGIKLRHVVILVSEDNVGPACIGVWNPKIVLPRMMASQWSERLLRPILAHELVHIRRGDIVWGYLQFLVQTIWWFHPLVWWLGRRASIICERCCDDEVVNTTRCSPGDYGESLVRVLEMKKIFYALPLSHAMSPVQITRHRLESLMNYSKKRRRPWLSHWLAALLLAAAILPGMQWVSGQDGKGLEKSNDEFRAQVNTAIEERDWKRAVGLLRPVADADEENGDAIFYLGYALHASGKPEEAISYHERAASFPHLKPIALYNWACALALTGEQEQAIEKLEQSLTAGFVHEADLTDDPDLESLADLEAFQKLREMNLRMQAKSKCKSDLDFWLGTWTVTDADGKQVGTNSITRSENGHLITEKWTSVGGKTGTSVNFFHPGTDKWQQTWVDDAGSVIDYTADLKDGAMHFAGTMSLRSGQKMKSRMTLTPKDDGSVEQFIESSPDDGKTWSVYFKGTYTKESQ